VLGKTTVALITAGLVKIADVVTRHRIRPPGEVIAKAKLTDAQLKAVKVHRVPDAGTGTDAEREAAHVQELSQQLADAAAAQEELVKTLTIAGRAGAGLAAGGLIGALTAAVAAWRPEQEKDTEQSEKRTNP
jgi:hypothetical protein